MKVKSGKITKFPFKEREYHQKPNNANDMNDLKRKNMLGYYLAGLIEGDGSIIVPKTHRNEKGKLLYPFYWFSIIDTITPPTEGIPVRASETIGKKTSNLPLHPDYVTGLIDGEGSFSVSILKRTVYKTGWSISPVFTISLHSRDAILLHRIQSFFGVGKITIRKRDGAVYYSVNSLADLAVIIRHFDKYPLLTKKQADF